MSEKSQPAITSYLDEFFSGLSVVRGPLCVAIAAFILLSQPDQMLEAYRVLAQDLAQSVSSQTATGRPSQLHWGMVVAQIAASYFALAIASLVIYYLVRSLAHASYAGKDTAGKTKQFVLTYSAPVIATIPLAGCTIGLLRAWHGQAGSALSGGLNVDDLQQLAGTISLARGHLLWAAGILLATMIALAITAFLWESRPSAVEGPELRDFPFNRRFRYTFYGLCIAILLALWLAPVALPQTVGILPFIALFLATIAIVASLLTAVFDRFRIPALAVLLGLAILFSGFDWNDNHELVLLSHQTKESRKRAEAVPYRSLNKELARWYAARADKRYYADKGKPYYVYVVAAEGGGLYAAYRAANFLASMQDTCPTFAQHVFAGVGVSGGSLGLATFSALISEFGVGDLPGANRAWQPCAATTAAGGAIRPVGDYERRADQFLSQDFLSPLASAFMFPDLLQRFIPVPVGSLDRARPFEESLKAAWARMLRAHPDQKQSTNRFAESLYDLWRVDQAAPALLLTATDVQFGTRVLFRPFEHRPQDNIPLELQTELGFDELVYNLNLCDISPSLATAVGVSARFPVITPAASLTRNASPCPKDDARDDSKMRGNRPGGRHKVRMADGGYFENTGVETAHELLTGLRKIAESDPNLRGKLEFRLLVLSIAGDYFQDLRGLDRPLAGFNEVYSPVQTLLSTRQARGHSGLVKALTGLTNADVLLLPLDTSVFKLPLGWQMSTVSRDFIRAHFPARPSCPENVRLTLGGHLAEPVDTVGKILLRNACAVQIIREQLMGE
jgi:hypothetical protein